MFIFRAYIINISQETEFEEGKRIYHVVDTPIKRGTGTYKLHNPNGTKEGIISWSQYGQDQLIDKLLNQKRNGFFVEIGGYDGETYTNSLFFEKERGWSGLLVEANPYTYELMVGKDRNCFMKNACISNTVPNMTFIVAGALTSAKEIASKQHRKRIESNAILYATDETWRHAKETVVVKCYSLSSLMNTLGHTHIDYFSLDVEGAEMIILQSIDWKHLDIDVFTIETDQHRQAILTFMKKHGYKWIQTILGDDVFRKIK
jgi:FkbM family methyltransferase